MLPLPPAAELVFRHRDTSSAQPGTISDELDIKNTVNHPSRIQTDNPNLLTDSDVEYSAFECCGDEDLVFLRCPACAHLMVFCYECDTLYPDLHDPAAHFHVALTRLEDRFVCPVCSVAFEDYYFLRQPHVDKYLATAEQVIAAGFGHLLAPKRRQV